MNIKVRVKTWEEIKICGEKCESGYNMFYDNGDFADRFTTEKKQYCDKIIELEGWNGNHGYSDSWYWSFPMLSEIDVKEHNRNGANS